MMMRKPCSRRIATSSAVAPVALRLCGAAQQISRSEAHWPIGTPEPIPQKKLAEPEGSAKFEQGGFTSRRRKGPKTLFPGASPGNSFGAARPRKLMAKQYRARRTIAVYAAFHQREFLLARLQKPQCCRSAVKY